MRRNACKALTSCDLDAVAAHEVIATWVSRLDDDEDQDVRCEACEALSRCGQRVANHAGAVDSIVAHLADVDNDVRDYVLEAMGTFAAYIRDAHYHDIILPLLTDDDPSERETACKALLMLGERSKPYAVAHAEDIWPQLEEWDDDFLIISVCEVVEKMLSDSDSVTPARVRAVADLLSYDDGYLGWDVRFQALCTLQAFGKHHMSQDIVDAIVACMEHGAQSSYTNEWNGTEWKRTSIMYDYSGVRRRACVTLSSLGEGWRVPASVANEVLSSRRSDESERAAAQQVLRAHEEAQTEAR